MNTLKHETLELRDRYDDEPLHSDQVARLAVQLFDSLNPAMQLNERSRQLLESAALLHDIGWSQTPAGKGHHKKSAELIRQHSWKSLGKEEVGLVAQIARYHRKSLPRPAHEAYQALSGGEKRLVLVLGGLLRVADALDRTHTSRIKSVSAEVALDAVVLRVETKGSWEEERRMVDAKKSMLELALEMPVHCELMPVG